MSKKSFKGNPALQFMSSKPEPVEMERGLSGESAIVEGAVNFMYITETKSKRFNLLMRPSLFIDLQRCAKERNLSVNEYIHSVLEASVGSSRTKVQKDSGA